MKTPRYVVSLDTTQKVVVKPPVLTRQKIKQIGWAKDRWYDVQGYMRNVGRNAFDK